MMQIPKQLLMAAILLAGCDPGTEQQADSAVRMLPSPASAGASLPRLSAAPDGEIWLSWVEPRGGGDHVLLFSISQDDGWSAPSTVVKGSNWFVNWADFPSVVPLGGNRATAHWLAKRPGGVYAYDVAMVVSSDGGNTWSEKLTPHTDGTATEHGFVSLFPVGKEIGAVWLDGRNMAEAGDVTDAEHGHGGGMTLRFGQLDMSGTIVGESLLDELTCDCCQTGAAVTENGPVIVYRDRTTGEIRDIYVTARRDGSWSEPVPVAKDSWEIAACPVNGPAIEAAGNNVVVAWFTGAQDQPMVRVAFSDDGGVSFGDPIDIDSGRVLGRVGVVLLDDGSAVASWMATKDQDVARIQYRRVGPDGGVGPSRLVAEVSGARSSGLPQMRKGGDGLIFAWTVPGEPSQVQTATVELFAGP